MAQCTFFIKKVKQLTSNQFSSIPTSQAMFHQYKQYQPFQVRLKLDGRSEGINANSFQFNNDAYDQSFDNLKIIGNASINIGKTVKTSNIKNCQEQQKENWLSLRKGQTIANQFQNTRFSSKFRQIINRNPLKEKQSLQRKSTKFRLPEAFLEGSRYKLRKYLLKKQIHSYRIRAPSNYNPLLIHSFLQQKQSFLQLSNSFAKTYENMVKEKSSKKEEIKHKKKYKQDNIAFLNTIIKTQSLGKNKLTKYDKVSKQSMRRSFQTNVSAILGSRSKKYQFENVQRNTKSKHQPIRKKNNNIIYIDNVPSKRK